MGTWPSGGNAEGLWRLLEDVPALVQVPVACLLGLLGVTELRPKEAGTHSVPTAQWGTQRPSSSLDS